MPLNRKTFDELARLLDLYRREVDVPSVTIDVTTVEGERLRVLKTLEVTETTVTLLVHDPQVGIDPSEGRQRHSREIAVHLPHEGVRSIVLGPRRAEEARPGFTTA